MLLGKVSVLTVVVASTVVVALVTGFWLTSVSGTFYKSFTVPEVYSKTITWINSENMFKVYDGFMVYFWDASNYWEIYLTLVNKGPGDLTVDDVFINGVPYYSHECFTKYHVLYRANGKFYVFPDKLVISPGGKVVLKIIVPGPGFETYAKHSSVFYVGDGSTFSHGDVLTISLVSEGSTVAVVMILP